MTGATGYAQDARSNVWEYVGSRRFEQQHDVGDGRLHFIEPDDGSRRWPDDVVPDIVEKSLYPPRRARPMSQEDALPELSHDQYEQLREDIRLRGVQSPVEICANSQEVLDGRARVQACSELKINNYPRRVVGGLDSDEARRHHRLKANCLRRHLDRPALKELILAEMRRKSSE